MGALVGLGVGIGLLLVWSAFFVAPAPRVARRHGHTAELLAQGRAGRGLDHRLPGPVCRRRGDQCVRGRGGVSRTPPVALAFGLIGGYLPVAVVSGRARRRQREFAEVWPEAVDNLSSAVRAGMSLPDALAALGVRGPEPLRSAFDAFALDYQVTGRFGESLDRLKAAAGGPGRRPRGRGAAGGPRGRRRRAGPAAAQPVRLPPRGRPHPRGAGVAPGLDRERRAAGRGGALAGAAVHVVPDRGDPPLRLAGRRARARGGCRALPGRPTG